MEVLPAPMVLCRLNPWIKLNVKYNSIPCRRKEVEIVNQERERIGEIRKEGKERPPGGGIAHYISPCYDRHCEQ
jgi:hypothetical protein